MNISVNQNFCNFLTLKNGVKCLGENHCYITVRKLQQVIAVSSDEHHSRDAVS